MTVTPAILAELPLFSSCARDELDQVATWAEERTVSPGERILGEGASGYSFFVLQSGSAVVTRDGQELRRLAPGDFFGELAILGDGRRSATVTAVEPTRLLVLFGTEFRRLETELPQIAACIRQAVVEREQTG
jgi:CRP-like cAMP-binding protein